MKARKIILAAFAALSLLSTVAAALAQVPAPVPALPDTERRISYSITASQCSCNINFALLGDSNDYQSWVEVFLNGVRVNFNDATFGWTITSPTGSLATIPRPITDAVLTFNSAQTGTVQIVGARRPRRVSQYQEGRGVPARNLNQDLTDIIAQNREIWDKTNDITGRALQAPPGETLAMLPPASSRANQNAIFDVGGNLTPGLPISNTASVSAAMQPVVAAATVASAQSQLGIAAMTQTCPSNEWVNVISTSGSTCAGQTDFVHLSTFSPVGDNSADDTTALQNWLNSCSANRSMCYLDPPSVCYRITAPLTITSARGATIVGPGRDKVGNGICLSSTTQNGIVATTLGQINLYGFRITGKALATAGDMVQINSGNTNPNQFSTFRDMWFQGGFVQLHFVTASGWNIDGSLFASPNTSGASIVIEDTTATDAGDQVIHASTFSGAAVATAIYQTSAGGLKVVGNKIINYATGYLLSLASGVGTSDLFFSANSMEAFTGSGIKLAKGSGTAFGTVVIVGNEINGCVICIDISDTNTGWLNNVTLANNIMAPNGGNCINIYGAGNFNISGGICQISSGTNTGILIGSNAGPGTITDVSFNGITTNYSISSTSTVVVDHQGLAFANLPSTAGNGSQIFAIGGAPGSSPCTGSSTGSMATRQNGAWKCF